MTHVSQNERIKSAAKNRKNKNRQKEIIISVIVILVLLVTVLVAGVALLKVGSVEVLGNDGRYTDDRIIEIAGISTDSSIMLLDEEKISSAVSLALPYIQTVSVSRNLPDHVQMEVTYAKEAFAVDCGQLWLILSADGKVLETMQTQPQNLTQLQGVLVNGYTVGKTAEFEDALYFSHAASVYNACMEQGLNDIRTLKTDPSGYVTLNIGNRFFVQSGSVHVLLEEMEVLEKVIREREEKKTAFTFTLAADGSITISNRELPPEEETDDIPVNPDVNMDSELVGGEGETSSPESQTDLSVDSNETEQTTQSDTLG